MTDEQPMNQYRMSERGLEPLTAQNHRDLHGAAASLGLRDKKKVAVLALLLVGGIGVVAFQFLRGKSPSTAAAMPAQGGGKPLVTGAASVGDIDTLLKDLERDASAAGRDTSVIRVEQLVKQFDGYVKQRQLPLAGLRANPFQMSLVQPVPQVSKAQQQADEDEVKREQLRMAASRLSLGSVMVGGGERLVLINGHVYREGDPVDGFRIERIEPNHVRLGAMGETVDLWLYEPTDDGKPGN